MWQDILRNVQEIVRSEVRLARAELREEAAGAKKMTLLFGAGAAAALIAVIFLLLGAVYALALILPSWAAAPIVGTSLTLVAGVLLSSGIKRFRDVYGPGPIAIRPEKGADRMDQTTEQIEAHIVRTREDLGSNLQELEQKVKKVADWREHVRENPMTMLGVAFGARGNGSPEE